ncbi:RNA polymerase subunit sigma-70 [Niastella koreensis]|uniref:RNA polymerase, sigma-24 subunit, ECF subfamily n=2 Tax=Niastella koreensis TaxID=354356 RepID=G8TI67_NIAKG|nr:sigma-70 family RNA polymerase sigma factor [Niastella koreensis]AEW00684.1 RNA polymerase, sigma-24 subunit, ECF subfamily [Niastella koreensis GR20-10]OQP42315.1 RNA polymerase subunit sigma-70 [Niastella koreensis]
MKTDSTDEKALLKGLALNDRKSVETIYKLYYNMVQTLIINNNGSADDARDIFQETVIVLYEKAKTGSFELTAQLKTYVYSVSRRLWLKKLQQQQKYLPTIPGLEETVPVEEDVESHGQRNSEFQMMEKALLHLGEPCRSLIEQFYLQKRSMTEIAGHFGYTNADNAKNQKYKCLMRLRKLFFAEFKNNDV